MSKQIPKNELDEILNIVARFPSGVPLGKIIESLNTPIPTRNLQTRLVYLVKKGLLRAEGRARGTVYKLPLDKKEAQLSFKESREPSIPLSPEAQEIQKLVTGPMHMRTPVGYNIEFLDEYRPNVSQYLSESTCQRLLELGKTGEHQPPGTYARQILGRLLIDLSWNSSRLEGNTYSLLETERLLELSQVVEGKDLREAQMILNHKEAIEFLIDTSPDIGINRPTILNLHTLLSNDLMSDLEACGRLRAIPIGIGKSVYQPLAMPQRIQELFQQVVDTARAIKNPFEQSFFLMVHLPYLQPFEDVNKRVSRLAANIPLIQNNLCPLSFVDVPQQTYVNGLLGVYELNRIELLRDVFVWAYERSCLRYSITRREIGDPDPFRIRYRKLITEIVARIVRSCLDKTAAIAAIREYAKFSISPEDQAHFIETVERDVMSLHEGNIARHRLRSAEYEAWHKTWV
ncbi:MAG: Fic family protein [Chlamydiae bacterium]|nr:Fic family protein [Chlamydiota bacterium]